MRPERWLTAAAFLTWAVAGLPVLADILSGELTGDRAVIWSMAFVAFGAALGLSIGRHACLPRSQAIPLLLVQSAGCLTMVFTEGTGTAGAGLAVIAAQLGAVMPIAMVWLWVAVQSVVLAAAWAASAGWIGAIAGGGSFAGFQAFTVAAMSLLDRERNAREALARANAELHATRALLAENTRVAERLRIARDLHDTLGHHLTALSLQLDLASRLADGATADRIREAHAITRLLLSDVRDVVSRTRDSGRVDLAGAIRTLAAGTSGVAVHVDMPEALDISDDGQAHALLRCVQEIITNTARHAGARNLWVRLASHDEGIVLHARDDGGGTDAVTWGHGLTGMRERFEEYAGRIDVRTEPGRGFEVHGVMPRAQAAS